MTKYSLFAGLTSAFAAVLLSACQTTPDENLDASSFLVNLPGTYKGTIAAGTGVDFPGMTKFAIDEKGAISGNYEFTENNAANSGKLTDCLQVADLSLHCQWTDKYGTGDLNVTFDANASKFDGKWNMKGSTEAFVWSGAK